MHKSLGSFRNLNSNNHSSSKTFQIEEGSGTLNPHFGLTLEEVENLREDDENNLDKPSEEQQNRATISLSSKPIPPVVPDFLRDKLASNNNEIENNKTPNANTPYKGRFEESVEKQSSVSEPDTPVTPAKSPGSSSLFLLQQDSGLFEGYAYAVESSRKKEIEKRISNINEFKPPSVARSYAHQSTNKKKTIIINHSAAPKEKSQSNKKPTQPPQALVINTNLDPVQDRSTIPPTPLIVSQQQPVGLPPKVPARKGLMSGILITPQSTPRAAQSNGSKQTTPANGEEASREGRSSPDTPTADRRVLSRKSSLKKILSGLVSERKSQYETNDAPIPEKRLSFSKRLSSLSESRRRLHGKKSSEESTDVQSEVTSDEAGNRRSFRKTLERVSSGKLNSLRGSSLGKIAFIRTQLSVSELLKETVKVGLSTGEVGEAAQVSIFDRVVDLQVKDIFACFDYVTKHTSFEQVIPGCVRKLLSAVLLERLTRFSYKEFVNVLPVMKKRHELEVSVFRYMIEEVVSSAIQVRGGLKILKQPEYDETKNWMMTFHDVKQYLR